MKKKGNIAKRRPAEIATVGAGGAAAAIAAIVGIDTTAAALIVAGVGAVPSVVTFVVDTVRRGAQTAVLADLTPKVADAAENILEKSKTSGEWTQQADALDRVAGAVSKWSDLLAVQSPGPDAKQD